MLAALALRTAVAALLTGAPLEVSVPAPPASLSAVRPAEMAVLNQVGAPAAWKTTRGKGVLVAVLDTGVDPTSPDLAGQVTTGPDYVASVDPPGYKPPLQHGTYIASLIAGHGRGPGDAMGIIGVAQAAKILSIRVIPDESEPGVRAYNSQGRFADAIANGIYYAVRRGASVINLSVGSQQPTASERTAIAYAISHDVAVIAAAGNSGSAQAFAPYVYPAAFPGVIAVGAIASSGTRAPFSEQNSSVIISGPGVDVLGAGPKGEYINADGTSPAAALVTGVVALIDARYPGLDPALIEQALITTASDKPTGGYSVQTGFGEVSAPGALKAAAVMASHDADGPDMADGSAPDSNLVDPGSMTGAVSIPGISRTADPQSRLARAPAPIVVTRRDVRRALAWDAVATAASVIGALALAALVVLVRWRRPRRAGLEMARFPTAGPPGDDLI